MTTLTSNAVVTYSPALTLVPTYECFNRCSYCNFRVDPGQDQWLTAAEAEARLIAAKSAGIVEILVLSGEVHPQSARRSAWLQTIYELCILAIEMGFLPHTNVGPLASSEMALLKEVNVSMGLMLEQLTPDLLQGVHRHAPSKEPKLRLQQLEEAGRLQIPFTTGLLLGIGESENDRVDTLVAIAECHDRWGHIQEVILQPHQPGTSQCHWRETFPAAALVEFVKTAQEHLPPEVVVQVPPNLVQAGPDLLQVLENGARDLGGLGPIDEVNPDFPHPTPTSLATYLRENGWQLQRRLPVYPQYDNWVPYKLQQSVSLWRQRLQ